MQKPSKPNAAIVDEFKGLTSLELTQRCPDNLTVFPASPCTNVDCPWSINCVEYMNCSFVASEAGEHPLQLIGDWLGISREGVRQIEKKALAKLRAATEQANHGTALRESLRTAGEGDFDSPYQGPELPDEADLLPAFYGRELD